eukprot:TRINITY_DN7307_c0_g1_i1.p1 TRINITY_DN7307_c0_g1~~TRINITY_DN7307_c0_g1_i1.p1  ORF type:complete len:211 (+),score=32.35 TRINITY_DN7307_c0_g1_i1:410-1042(+)
MAAAGQLRLGLSRISSAPSRLLGLQPILTRLQPSLRRLTTSQPLPLAALAARCTALSSTRLCQPLPAASPPLVRWQSTQPRSDTVDDDDHHDEEKEKQQMQRMTIMQRLKYLISRYGKVAAGVYFIMGLCDLSIYYTAISNGVDVDPLLDSAFSMVGLDYKDYVSASMGALVGAYTIHKLMTPPRVILTASITPSLARRLAKRYPKWFGR